MKSTLFIACFIVFAGLATLAGDVTPGVISTIAGNGTAGAGGDGGPAISAQLHSIAGITVDPAGNLYIADNVANNVRKVSPDGVIGTAVGRAAGLIPLDVASDAAGNLYVADYDKCRVVKVTPAGALTTLASEICFPVAIASDPAGNVYVATMSFWDIGSDAVLKVSPDGTVRVFSGGFVDTSGLAVDSAGNLYVAASSSVWKMDPRGSLTRLPFNEGASDVAIDGAGNLFVADYWGSRIRKVSPDGIVTTVAGDGTAGFSGDGGPATSAQLNKPTSVTVDNLGNLLIGDSGNRRIRKVTWAAGPETSYYLPHVLSGQYGEGSFRTTFVLVNNTDSSVSVALRLTRGDTTIDGNPVPVSIPGLGTNSAFSFALAPGATRFLQTDGTGSLVSRAAVVTTSAPIGVSAIFSDYDSRGNFLAESGADASSLVQEFVFPVDEAGPIETSLALYSPQGSEVSLTLLDTAGAQQIGHIGYNLAADERSLLNRVTENLPGENFRGTAVLHASAPVAALALRGRQASYPHASLPVVARTAGKTSWSLAQVVNGGFGSGRFATSFQIFNLSPGPANVIVMLTRDDGTPLVITIPDKGTGSRFNFTLPPGAATFLETDGTGPMASGAAVIASDARIGASAMLRVLDLQGNLLSETGMGDSPVLSQFTFPVDVTASFDTGIAFHNPSTDMGVILNLVLVGAEGEVAGRTQLIVPAKSHIARLASELFPGTANFQGSIAVTGTGSVAVLALRQNTTAGTPSYTNLPVTLGVAQGPAGATRVGPKPTQINGLTGVVDMWDGVLVKSDGTFWGLSATGDDERTPVVYMTPTPIDGLAGVVALSGSLVLKNDGTVWESSGSQLKQVSGLSDIVMVHQSSGGGWLALKGDGSVWTWNADVSGVSAVSNPPGAAVAVASLAVRGLALMDDGTVWVLPGLDNYWLRFRNLDAIIAIDGAYFEGLALKSDGTVWELGYATGTQVQGIPRAVSISSGDSHSMVLAQDGTVWEWGVDFYSHTTWPTPRQANGLAGVVKIESFWRYSIAVKSDGTVWMWTTD